MFARLKVYGDNSANRENVPNPISNNGVVVSPPSLNEDRVAFQPLKNKETSNHDGLPVK